LLNGRPISVRPYSDGEDVETRILEALKKCKDVSVLSEELESHIIDWTSLCFFSKKRSNLLRPFAALFKGKTLLEIGCGAGPITRFLAECGATVYAIEPSFRRATIAAERCRELDNVTIICDDIAHFECDRTFDGIIQVGVLEYAAKYSHESDATLKFLENLKKYLTDDGFLITAIENQLGLKYFSGFMEDHNGVLMHSINNNYKPGEATTMGRKKLLEVFGQAGFGSNDLFLPFPDYKMPTLVFYPGFNEKNEQCNVNIESILSNISYQDQQQYMPLFSLDKALPLIAQNDLLYDLSNSFCIFSQNKPVNKVEEDILFAFYRTDLKKEYCKQTLFKQDGAGVKVVRGFLNNVQPGNEGVFSFEQEEPVYSGVLHHYGLVDIINRNHWRIEQVGEWLAAWFNCLKEELRKQYGFNDADLLRHDLKIKSLYIDALPINLLMQDNGHRFIDLEINLHKDVELGYIIFRSVYVSISRLSSVAVPADNKYIEVENIIYAMFEHLGMPLNAELLDKYYEFEAGFVANVAPVKVATMKGAISQLRVRSVINDLHNTQNRIQSLQTKLQSLEGELEFRQANIRDLNKLVHGLNHEIHTLSTSRKRMIKQFIKRTLPFLNTYL
jgi:2-polyprenyl-3-methyl-5-hydroxy-6-metoxy-1,4-benzoquinol methylase